ncbi:hypothetical protein [Pseudohalocynthiibacter sp. F2068]|uniref:hypothetical protein n=1 Tax=Pseudohalocynthiibacter sp. F2068 TaxID=2926418 RepID=UPI001FF1B3C6|nr:hypothetical protein [Pseudohalocynthiibacter sp. F2068]MCK0103648.1 hypothetical protein [Pseudohalocynthiibacter sp. F2068]
MDEKQKTKRTLIKSALLCTVLGLVSPMLWYKGFNTGDYEHGWAMMFGAAYVGVAFGHLIGANPDRNSEGQWGVLLVTAFFGVIFAFIFINIGFYFFNALARFF